MTMNPLPPQAYTKETLTTAYQWLLTQPPQIKELATSPDILVSIFNRARMNGIESLDRPSVQNFRSELKSLAGMMGDLSANNNQVSPAPTAAAQTSSTMTAPVSAAYSSRNSSNYSSGNSSSTQQPTAVTNSGFVPQANALDLDIDLKTKSMVQEIKHVLNLSNDSEALRALVSIGYQQLKSALPKN